jgi:hypothetical protein
MTNLIAILFIVTSIASGLGTIDVDPLGYAFPIGTLITYLLVVVAGIGALWRRDWARQLLLGACVYLAFLMLFVPVAVFASLWLTGKGWYLLLVLAVPLTIFLLYRAYRHLNSPVVARTFFKGFGRTLPAEKSGKAGPLFLAAVYLILAFAVNGKLRLSADNLPGFMLTSDMSKTIAERRTRHDAALGTQWLVSDDERTIVFEAGDPESTFVVLNVESGKLSRKPRSVYTPIFWPWPSISPDASLFIDGEGQLITMADDKRRPLETLKNKLGITRLGFQNASRFLIYENRHMKLIDIGADRPTYEVALPHDYDFRTGLWSPDRKKFLWLASPTDRTSYVNPREVNILHVESGVIDTVEAPCEIRRSKAFAQEGDLVYLDCKAAEWAPVTRNCHPTLSGGGNGLIYDTVAKQFSILDDLPYGDILYASSSEDRMVYSTVCSDRKTVSGHPSRSFGDAQWSVSIGASSTPFVTRDGRSLLVVDGNPVQWSALRHAELSNGVATSFSVKEANTILSSGNRVGSSPQGSLLLLLASPFFEVVWVDTLGQQPATSFAIDLRDGKRLTKPPQLQ